MTPIVVAQGHPHHRGPLLEADTPRQRTGLLTLEPTPGAEARTPCWPGRSAWLQMLSADLDTDHGHTVRRRHGPSAATVLAVAADDAAHADTRTGRNVATSWDRTARRIGCKRDTVRRAQRILRALGWSVEITRGRHLTGLERMKASLAGRPQHQAASLRSLSVPARCRHLIPTAQPADQPTEQAEPTAGQQGFHPHPAGVPSSFNPPTSPVRKTRSRASGTAIHPSKNPRPRQQRTSARPAAPEPISIGMQRLTAALVARLPRLDDGQHLNALSRALQRIGITTEWTAQDLLNALDERNRAQGLVSLPAGSQRNPRGLLLAQLRQAITNATPPARAREQAHQQARARAAETHARIARDQAIREANARARAADPRPFRQRWAATIAAAQTT